MANSLLVLSAGHTTPAVNLPQLVTDGQFYALSTGERFYLRGTSSFAAYERYLREGWRAVDALFQVYEDLGFNGIRFFTSYLIAGVGALDPAEWPAFYQRMKPFGQLAGDHGLYLGPVAYSGFPPAFQPDHWQRLGDALSGLSNVACYSLVNEGDQPSNRLPSDPFVPIPGLLCSHGSNGSEAWPPTPVSDVTELHTNGAFEEQRKVSHNAMEVAQAYGVLCWTSEMSRYPEVGMWSGSDQARCQQLAYDTGAASALLNGGLCWHSVQGKLALPPTADEAAVIQSLMAGIESVPLSCQPFPYHRLDPDGYLRIYQRGDQAACMVPIRV